MEYDTNPCSNKMTGNKIATYNIDFMKYLS